jgi:hypothetical protein
MRKIRGQTPSRSGDFRRNAKIVYEKIFSVPAVAQEKTIDTAGVGSGAGDGALTAVRVRLAREIRQAESKLTRGDVEIGQPLLSAKRISLMAFSARGTIRNFDTSRAGRRTTK